MMKQQFKETKLPPPSKKEVMSQQEDKPVRKEELYLPQAIQDEAKKSFEHGFSYPAAGGLTSVPVTCKEVADS
eukprot:10566504-Prorocentrum_lima.AAC.1